MPLHNLGVVPRSSHSIVEIAQSLFSTHWNVWKINNTEERETSTVSEQTKIYLKSLFRLVIIIDEVIV